VQGYEQAHHIDFHILNQFHHSALTVVAIFVNAKVNLKSEQMTE
jgi:hypothetical protein